MYDESQRAADMKRIAIHEAGHFIASQHFGCRAEIRIEEADTSGPTFVFPYKGACFQFEEPEDEHERRVICLAGSVANFLDDDVWYSGGELDSASLDTYQQRFVLDVHQGLVDISQEDFKYGFDEDAVEEALFIISRNWEELNEKAQEEIDKLIR